MLRGLCVWSVACRSAHTRQPPGRAPGGHQAVIIQSWRDWLMSVRRDNGLTRVRRGVRGSGALAALLAMGISAVASGCSFGGSSSSGCTQLNVAVAPQIAPAIQSIAAKYNGGHPQAGGNCVRVNMRAAAPAGVASALSGQGAMSQNRPDAWIPDSTLWIDEARTTASGAARVAAMGESVAMSPIVIALPRTVALALAKTGKRPSWKMLVPSALPSNAVSGSPADVMQRAMKAPFQLKVLDPAANAAGMAGLLAMRTVVGHGVTGLVKFVTVARVSQFLTVPNDGALFSAMSGATPTAGIASEQSVLAHNKADPQHPVVAVYPSEGSPVLDFPYVATTQNNAKSQAFASFAQALRKPAADRAILALGLRTPDGTAAPGVGPAVGVSAQPPAPIPLPSPAVANAVRGMWARILIGARMLITLDESPSMGKRVEGTKMTRLQAILKMSGIGISLFNKNDVIGLWTFDTGLSDPNNYRVVLPMRPLNQRIGDLTQRELLLGAIAAQKPQVDTVTALYETIRSAYREVTRGYVPDRFNGVVVDTDGTDFDYRPHKLSLKELVSTLRREFDPQRPVNVLLIGYGHSADFAAMKQIADATQGAAYELTSPAGIEKFYLSMLTRLVCDRNCPLP
jgi:Bacterial extracellular solute-binding protein